MTTSAIRITVLLGVILTGGCANMATVVSDYCQNSGIIRPSRRDTPGTLRQVAVANEKYRSLCVAP